MVKVTYSLDDATVRRIRRAAERLGKPRSQVVREAVAEYDARTDRLSEAERLRMLDVLDRWRKEHTPRSPGERRGRAAGDPPVTPRRVGAPFQV